MLYDDGEPPASIFEIPVIEIDGVDCYECYKYRCDALGRDWNIRWPESALLILNNEPDLKCGDNRNND